MRAVSVLLVLLAAACGSRASTPPRALAAHPQAPPATRDLEDVGWQRFVAPRFSLEFALPEADEWRIDDRSERWLVATHPGSESVLRVRSWREGSLATPARCETVARGWRKEIAVADHDVVVDDQMVEAPAGYASRVLVGVVPERGSTSLSGFVLLFGANVRQCVAMEFTTRATGAGAEAEVGRRLGLVAGGVPSRLVARGVEARAPRPGMR